MFRRYIFSLGKNARGSPSVALSAARAAGTRHQHQHRMRLAFTFASVFAAGTYLSSQFVANNAPIQLDSQKKAKSEEDLAKHVTVTDKDGVELVQPPTSSPPFPVKVKVGSQDFDLLGVGVRYVSIFSFHVYALGVYIASEDRALAKSILDGAVELSPEHDLKSALLDPELGTKIFTHLLDHGVRLDFRIVPVRNTDFGHWRDAFVRNIIGHPLFKQINSLDGADAKDIASKLGEGINEFKVALSRKLSVPKGNILHMTRDSSGALHLLYYKSTDEKAQDVEIIDLGTVQNPNVSKILALQYLAGKYVSSENTRMNVVEGLTKL